MVNIKIIVYLDTHTDRRQVNMDHQQANMGRLQDHRAMDHHQHHRHRAMDHRRFHHTVHQRQLITRHHPLVRMAAAVADIHIMDHRRLSNDQ